MSPCVYVHDENRRAYLPPCKNRPFLGIFKVWSFAYYL